jgi:hypothetical protein
MQEAAMEELPIGIGNTFFSLPEIGLIFTRF